MSDDETMKEAVAGVLALVAPIKEENERLRAELASTTKRLEMRIDELTQERDEARAQLAAFPIQIDGRDVVERSVRRMQSTFDQLAACRAPLEETPENVEALARVILAADRLHSDGGATPWEGLADDYHEVLRADARAVLTALRARVNGSAPGVERPFVEEETRTAKAESEPFWDESTHQWSAEVRLKYSGKCLKPVPSSWFGTPDPCGQELPCSRHQGRHARET